MQTALELTVDVYDENRVIYYVFSAFVYLALGGTRSKHCTNHPRSITASKKVHGSSQYHELSLIKCVVRHAASRFQRKPIPTDGRTMCMPLFEPADVLKVDVKRSLTSRSVRASVCSSRLTGHERDMSRELSLTHSPQRQNSPTATPPVQQKPFTTEPFRTVTEIFLRHWQHCHMICFSDDNAKIRISSRHSIPTCVYTSLMFRPTEKKLTTKKLELENAVPYVLPAAER